MSNADTMQRMRRTRSRSSAPLMATTTRARPECRAETRQATTQAHRLVGATAKYPRASQICGVLDTGIRGHNPTDSPMGNHELSNQHRGQCPRWSANDGAQVQETLLAVEEGRVTAIRSLGGRR